MFFFLNFTFLFINCFNVSDNFYHLLLLHKMSKKKQKHLLLFYDASNKEIYIKNIL